MDIAVRYELMGMSADRIVDEYPHLKLEQIHDALSYYYEHKSSPDKKHKDDQTVLTQLIKQYPSNTKTLHSLNPEFPDIILNKDREHWIVGLVKNGMTIFETAIGKKIIS